MTLPPGIDGVTPVDELPAGPADSSRASWEEDLALGDTFASELPWCGRIVERHVGCHAGPVSIRLYRIEPTRGADEWFWIAVGHASPAIIPLHGVPTPACAAAAYCREMDRWVAAVRDGRPLDGVWPLLTADGRGLLEPTPETADVVEERVAFMRGEVLPGWADEIAGRCPDADP